MSGKIIESVLVVGLGKVGKLAAILLHEAGYRVSGLDSKTHGDVPFGVRKSDVSDAKALARAVNGHDAVVTCLPYHLNLGVARAAHSAGRHYFDLTEDVATTQAVRELSASAKGVMAPQCGLAPGFISVAGADLTKKFERLRSIELRVGALPQHPRGLLGYAFNWSPEGVVNEYLNDCDVIKDGKRAKITAMEGLETIVIDGVQLEAFTTSGGLGTMCETFEGKVSNLNYKTIRYPGHCQLMSFFFNELHMRDERKRAGEILVNAKPPVKDDVVYVHAAVEGRRKGKQAREEFVRSYYPLGIAGESWKAISWTTAASVCAVLELVAGGDLPSRGFLKQEDIPLEKFFRTPTGSLYLKGPSSVSVRE
ncbi:MAG: saccharopine dehydrogenase NADP-binding domain-containing protein [Nitrospinae bacterium]|nr:saccharopine dehydrogenase NADP-binding domain-containing protein [Nitrospinota bacterium]